MTVLVVSSQGPVDVVLSFEDRSLVTTIFGPAKLPPVPAEIVDLVEKLTADGLQLTAEVWAIRTPLQ
jgi:hypothetical protein